MSAPTTTPTLSMQSYFSTTLSSSIVAGDTVIPCNAVPNGTEGFLVIDQDSSAKEIIYFNSKGASSVTCPSAASGRGQGGTTAGSHSSGATVKMNFVDQYWSELQNGHAMGASSITPSKLALSPQTATVATSETTGSTSYANLTTTTDTITATIGANGIALVIIGATFNNSGANITYSDFGCTGTNTRVAQDATALEGGFSSTTLSASKVTLLTGLNAGSTVFKMYYRVTAGTGTFANRSIAVIPL